MDKNTYAITELVRVNYPHLLDNDTTVTDYCFIDSSNNKEIPTKDFDEVNKYKLLSGTPEILLVIFFSDNTIGYRLKL